VESNIEHHIPSFTVVGLPDNAVRESRERVVAAIRNSGFEFPPRKVTVNLAPADLKKEGSAMIFRWPLDSWRGRTSLRRLS